MRWIRRPAFNPIEIFWSHVHEPKTVTVFMALSYVLAFAAGGVLVYRDTDLAQYVQGLILLAGGSIGALSCLIGYYKLERPAAVLSGTGVLTWLITTEATVTALIGAMALILYVTRWLRIRDLDVTPGKPLVSVRGLTK